MANKNRMEGLKFKYFNQHTYMKHAVRRNNEPEKDMPDYYQKDSTKSITVPGQSVTIKELMDRYEKGRPIPTIE